MEVCTLASGSSGNSLLICCGSTYVLLDAGISARRITSALKALGPIPPGSAQFWSPTSTPTTSPVWPP